MHSQFSTTEQPLSREFITLAFKQYPEVDVLTELQLFPKLAEELSIVQLGCGAITEEDVEKEITHKRSDYLWE